MQEIWHVLEINAEPWAIGPLSIRRTSNGKMIPLVGPNKQVQAFQNAVREILNDKAIAATGDLEVDFWIWRQLDELNAGKARKHQADATNIQKALEDALQGVLLANDRQVRRIQTHIVDQGPTSQRKIILRVRPYADFDPDSIPEFVWTEFDKTPDLFDNRLTEILENVREIF